MKRNPSDSRTPCPCGAELSYADCCGRWHAGIAQG
jgi:SEC-C motif domain protein